MRSRNKLPKPSSTHDVARAMNYVPTSPVYGCSAVLFGFPLRTHPWPFEYTSPLLPIILCMLSTWCSRTTRATLIALRSKRIIHSLIGPPPFLWGPEWPVIIVYLFHHTMRISLMASLNLAISEAPAHTFSIPLHEALLVQGTHILPRHPSIPTHRHVFLCLLWRTQTIEVVDTESTALSRPSRSIFSALATSHPCTYKPDVLNIQRARGSSSNAHPLSEPARAFWKHSRGPPPSRLRRLKHSS